MKIHVRYASLISTQPVDCKIGNQFNYFLIKGAIIAKNDFMSTTVNNYFGLSYEDIKIHEKKNYWKAPTLLDKGSDKMLIWMTKYDDLE